jgi:hypothetical protein
VLGTVAIFTEICKAEVAGSIVDEAVAVRHGAFLVVFQFFLLEVLLYAYPQLAGEHVHLLMVAILELA